MKENFKESSKISIRKSHRIRDQLTKMSKRHKIICAIRILIMIACTIGLIYQTIQLYKQYMLGRTVVNINYEHKTYHHIPGITICYPAALSMAKMAEKYPKLRPIYENYMERVNRMKDEDSNDEIEEKILTDIYSNNFTKFIYNGDVYENGEVVSDFFDLSLPFDKNERGNTIQMEAIGISKNGSSIDDSGTGKVIDDTPVESFVFSNRRTWRKCYTFYSHLKQKWREYQMDITKILITVSHDESWFPRKFLLDYDLQLSMHSPNDLPRHDVQYYIDLKAYRFIRLTYNRWKTQLLGDGYQTNCTNYKLEDKHYYKRMRSDCVKHCIQQKLIPFTDCHKSNTCERCVVPTSVLWTKTELIENNLTNVCQYSRVPYFASVSGESSCQSICRHKCVERYYNYEIKSISDREYPNTTITIQHNQLPDQITEHIPEMTFIQFCANFGGLLGIWMGLSALAIFKYIISFCFG